MGSNLTTERWVIKTKFATRVVKQNLADKTLQKIAWWIARKLSFPLNLNSIERDKSGKIIS